VGFFDEPVPNSKENAELHLKAMKILLIAGVPALMSLTMVLSGFGCTTRKLSKNVSPSTVSIVDSKRMELIEKLSAKKLGPISKDGYKTWERYHNAIEKVLNRYGKAQLGVSVDFYHGGDWFHEHFDAFALMKLASLNKKALQELQEVVAQHHPNAVLVLGTPIEAESSGLNIRITSKGIYVAWQDESATLCRQNIERFGIPILE
jgi:hypothetical protein